MLILYAFFATFLFFTTAAAFLAARYLWSRTRAGACFSVIGILTLGALLFPLPIHGGFTVLGLVFFEEISRQKQHLAETLDEKKDAAFEHRLEQRFSDRLPYSPLHNLSDPWDRIDVGYGLKAYLQKDANLIWTVPLLWEGAPPHPDLPSAREFCRNLSPRTYWDLPTEAELYHFWAAGGPSISPGSGHSSLAVLVNLDMNLEILTRYAGSRAGIALRCVALGPGAPRTGYTQQDIPLTDWNRFQLSKAEVFRTGRE